MLKNILATLAALILLGGLGCAVVVGAKAITVRIDEDSYKNCLSDTQAKNNQPPDCPKTETLWDRGLRDPVAYYSLWLAFFTLALAVGGLVQSILIGRQITLARDEFNATHRPHIRVHSINFYTAQRMDNPLNELVGARIIYANDGDQPAVIEWIKYKFIQETLPLRGGIFPHLDAKLPEGPIIGGLHGWFDIVHDWNIDTVRISQNGASLFLIGTIKYRARSGNSRLMGFCRRAEISKGECFWRPYENPEYEYSY